MDGGCSPCSWGCFVREERSIPPRAERWDWKCANSGIGKQAAGIC